MLAADEEVSHETLPGTRGSAEERERTHPHLKEEEWQTVDGACWLPWCAGVWCFLPLRVLGTWTLVALCVACSSLLFALLAS